MASPAAVLAIHVKANTRDAQAALAKTDAQVRKTTATSDQAEKSVRKVAKAHDAAAAAAEQASLKEVRAAKAAADATRAQERVTTASAKTRAKAEERAAIAVAKSNAEAGNAGRARREAALLAVAATNAAEGLALMSSASTRGVSGLSGLASGAANAASQLAAMGPAALAVLAAVAALAVVIMAVVAALVALVASLAAAVAAIGVLGVALGAAAGAAVLFGVAFAKAMKANGPVIQKFKQQIKGLGVTLRNAAGPGIQAFIGRLGPAIGGVRDLLNGLRPAFLTFGRAAGDSVALIGRGFKSLGPQIQQAFGGAAKLMRALAPAVTPLVGIFLNLANAAMPFLVKGAAILTQWLTRLHGTTSNAKLMRGVIQTLVGHFTTWWNIIKQVGRILFAVLRGAAGEGKNLGDSIGGALKRMADFLNSAEGQQKLHNFFRNLIGIVRVLWTVFKNVTKAAMWMGTAIAAALNFIIPKARAAAHVVGTVFGGAFRGLAAAARWVGGAVRAAFNGIVTAALWVGRGILGMVSKFLGGIQTMVATMAKIPGVGRAFRGLADQIGGAKRRIDSLRGSLAAANPAYTRTANAIRNMTVRGRGDLNRLAANAKTNMEGIRKHLGVNSEAGRKAVQHNFGVARDKVIQAMRAGKISTKEGMSRIADLMRTYGIKGKRATDEEFGRVKQLMRGHVGGGASAVGKGMRFIDDVLGKGLKKYGAKPMKGGAVGGAKSIGDIVGKGQRGGAVSGGKPSGDTIPAVLERGEYVLNRNAVKQAGVQKLNALNYGQAPRFQQGGPVGMQKGGGLKFALGPENIPPIKYDANHAGGNSHLHITMNSKGAVVQVGKKLQKMGWQVGEHPSFGGVQARHSPTGGHYNATAIDANTSADETHSELAAAARLLKTGKFSGAGGVGDIKIPRWLIRNGADFGRSGQAAVDKSRTAAQKVLDEAAPAEGAESGPLMRGSGDVERVFAKVAKRLSRSKTATMALGMAGYAESGMKDLAGGDASSQGALQLLASTASGLGVSPHDEAAIASLFFNRGFFGRGGANKLAAQGLPAHLVAQNVQGSAFSSGSNYAAKAGPARAWMRRFNLRKGGLVGMAKGGLAGQVGATSKLFGAKGKKGSAGKRSKSLAKLLKNVKGWGLKKGTTDRLTKLTTDAATYGEYADRAGQLTTDGSPAGMVNGLGEGGWLQKQLEALFALRNRLIEAQEALQARQAEQVKALAAATRQHSGFVKRIKGGDGAIKKFSKSKAGKTKAGKKILKGMKDTQTRRKRARDVLKNRVMPSLTEQSGLIGEKRTELAGSLEQVQGVGAPMKRLGRLPAPGVLGGDIFNTQIRLRDLGQKSTVTDSGNTERTDILKQQGLDWQRRFNVSQAQYGVLKDFPYAGSFGGGGVVSGPTGAPKQAVVHGREGIFTPDQMAAMGGGNVSVKVLVHEGGGGADVYVNDKRIDAAVERVTRKQARSVGRTPGSAGALR